MVYTSHCVWVCSEVLFGALSILAHFILKLQGEWVPSRPDVRLCGVIGNRRGPGEYSTGSAQIVM